jgi:hypothetical protein
MSLSVHEHDECDINVGGGLRSSNQRNESHPDADWSGRSLSDSAAEGISEGSTSVCKTKTDYGIFDFPFACGHVLASGAGRGGSSGPSTDTGALMWFCLFPSFTTPLVRSITETPRVHEQLQQRCRV